MQRSSGQFLPNNVRFHRHIFKNLAIKQPNKNNRNKNKREQVLWMGSLSFFLSQFNSYLCSKQLRFILKHVCIHIIFSATVFSSCSIHNATSTSLCVITTVHLKSRSKTLQTCCNLTPINPLRFSYLI